MNDYTVSIPVGRRGNWTVERVTPSESDVLFHNMKNPGRSIPPGKPITRLMYQKDVIMSDTSAEIRDHMSMIRRAKGNILINGLGIGMVLQACLENPSVEHATVIEIDADVIALVAPHYQERYGDRVTIIHADAFTWQPPKGMRYNAVWHDIWPNICGDNLPEMTQLKRKYGRRTDWQGCWCEAECKPRKGGNRWW